MSLHSAINTLIHGAMFLFYLNIYFMSYLFYFFKMFFFDFAQLHILVLLITLVMLKRFAYNALLVEKKTSYRKTVCERSSRTK